jgi:MraZ protein
MAVRVWISGRKCGRLPCSVFKGTYQLKIDPKGRLPVPAAFRRDLSQANARAVVVTAMDQCLSAFAPGEWERLEDQLRALPAFSRPVKALTRLLTSRAVDCELDVQGRILLPSWLRQTAALGREATVIGVLNRFEIWPPEAWTNFVRESERLLEDVSVDVQWPPAPHGSLPASAPPTPLPGDRPQGKPSR